MGITVSGISVSTAVRVDSLEIDSNTINYGYNSINLYAATGTSVAQFNKIRNNNILNAQQYSIYLVYQQTPEVLNNLIVNRGSNAGVGVYCQNVTTPATGTLFTNISGNKMINYATAGIYLATCTNAAATLKGRIANNAIGGGEKLAAGNPVYATGSTNWNICNNSINHDINTTAITAAGIRLVGAAGTTFGISIINNVIAVTGTGIAVPLHAQVIGNIDAMDYNLFYRTDTSTNSVIAYMTANIGYYQLKGSSNFNKNSVIYRPGFTSATDLTPNPADSASWSINGRGTYLSYLPTDFNRVQRPATNWDGVPDIGAYEFTPTSTPPAAKAYPDTSFAFTTQAFVFATDTVAKITWGGAPPGYIAVRQYSGVLPISYDPAKNFMYFYTSVTTLPLSSIDLYYRDNWIGTHTSETGIRYEQMDQGAGVWTAYPSASSVDTVKNFISLAFFTTSVPLTYSSGTNNNSTTLPVTLLQLKAFKINRQAIINWSTASEKNCSHFDIERSLDGKTFAYAGTIAATGNSNKLSNYRFADDLLALPAPAGGLVYYRLKITDNDGSATWSKTVFIDWNDALTADKISVYPNPFKAEFYIDATMTGADKNAKLVLTDLAGKVLLNKTISLEQGDNVIKLDHELNSGIYFLSVQANGNTSMVKLIKE